MRPYGNTATFNLFQSTLPLRGATSDSNPAAGTAEFQSTLPLRGATTRCSC
ncbi:hypothetical protein HMPREF0620_0515 [Parascardovia denticolens DSM 10105 = JCM 12538]|uniref:Uncharacterized protein n=1 Tax=Parascardovia denticolens DSM 10105 = JCM 12538 TaxID=864564 RepID=E6K129_PARDN|nr:hypothetical protein HMPREF0620_0515 [Parascardovia denticolens DSM 10105 = JCM 12538]